MYSLHTSHPSLYVCFFSFYCKIHFNSRSVTPQCCPVLRSMLFSVNTERREIFYVWWWKMSLASRPLSRGLPSHSWCMRDCLDWAIQVYRGCGWSGRGLQAQSRKLHCSLYFKLHDWSDLCPNPKLDSRWTTPFLTNNQLTSLDKKRKKKCVNKQRSHKHH